MKQASAPKQEIEKLWKRYLSKRDYTTRNKIVEFHSSLVYAHASRLTRKLPAQISYDEICSAAFDGLIEAVEAYESRSPGEIRDLLPTTHHGGSHGLAA